MKKRQSLLQKILLTLSLIFIIFILTLIFLHEIFITPRFVEHQVTRILKKSFNMRAVINIRSISLIKGIELENLRIYNPPEFRKEFFLKADRVRIKYNLFSLFLFKVRVDEIIFDRPYVSLEYNSKSKKWNFSDLIKPSEEKKKKESKAPLKIDVDLKTFAVNDFSMEFIKNFYFKLSGINLAAKVKLGETSVKGIDTLKFRFFNSGKKNIIFDNRFTKLVIPLDLDVDIDIKNRRDGKIKMHYELKDQLMEMNNKFFELPEIEFTFDSDLITKDSSLLINTFLLKINKDRLINLSGKIVQFDGAPRINLSMKENAVDLKEFQNLMKLFMNQKNLQMGGAFKTSRFSFKKDANAKTPLLSGRFDLNHVNFSLPDSGIYLKDLNFSTDVRMDSKKSIIGNTYLNINTISAKKVKVTNFNMNASLFFKPGKGIASADLFIDNCKVNEGDFLTEIVYKHDKLSGTIRLENLDVQRFSRSIAGTLNITDKFYSKGSRKYVNSLKMNITNLKLATRSSNKYDYSDAIPLAISSKQVMDIKTKKMSIDYLRFKISDIISMVFKGAYQNNEFNGRIQEFKIKTGNILNKLPDTLAYNIPFKSFKGDINTVGRITFKNKVLKADIITTNDQLLLDNDNSGLKIKDLYSRVNFVQNANNVRTINYSFSISDVMNKIVSYNSNTENYETEYKEFLNKVTLENRTIAGKNLIDVKKFDLNIPNINFNCNISGKVKTKPDPDYKLLVKVIFEPPDEIIFLKNGKIDGSLNLISTIRSGIKKNDFIINGKVLFNELSFFMQDIAIEKIDGYLPFSHVITKSKLDRKALLAKSTKDDIELLNYPLNREYLKKPDNFTFKKIKVKDIDINNFAMDMEYKNNYLSLKKGYVELLDGSIAVNNSFFDLGNMDPETIRAKLNVEISDIDIRALKFIKNVDEDEETRIIANVRLNAKGIDFKKLARFENPGDISGSFNITKIGRQVAARFLTAMDPNGKDGNVAFVKDLLYGGAWPELFTLELKFGQISSKIWIDKKFYMFWMPLPPSPIEFKDKSLDEIMQNFKRSKKG